MDTVHYFYHLCHKQNIAQRIQRSCENTFISLSISKLNYLSQYYGKSRKLGLLFVKKKTISHMMQDSYFWSDCRMFHVGLHEEQMHISCCLTWCKGHVKMGWPCWINKKCVLLWFNLCPPSHIFRDFKKLFPKLSQICDSPQSVFREGCGTHVSSLLSSHLVVQLKTKTWVNITAY